MKKRISYLVKMLKNEVCQILLQMKKIIPKNPFKKYIQNKYIKDPSSTPKVNIDMVKKVTTDKEMITCNQCRYECLKGKTSKEAHDN